MINSSEKNDEIDFTSRKGHFGWETVNNGVVVPVIYRDTEKFTPLKLLESSIFPWFYSNHLNYELKKFEFIPKYEMTTPEAILFNEINFVHCDSKYNLTFQKTDLLVNINDAKGMVQILQSIYKKLLIGHKCTEVNFGFVQIQSIDKDDWITLPYIKRGVEKFVPYDLIKTNDVTDWMDITPLTNVEVESLCFLFKIMKLCTKPTRFSVLLSEYLKKASVRYLEYWPDSAAYQHLLLYPQPAAPVFFNVTDYRPNQTQNYHSQQNSNLVLIVPTNKRTHERTNNGDVQRNSDTTNPSKTSKKLEGSPSKKQKRLSSLRNK